MVNKIHVNFDNEIDCKYLYTYTYSFLIYTLEKHYIFWFFSLSFSVPPTPIIFTIDDFFLFSSHSF